jgi:hypothetical protein
MTSHDFTVIVYAGIVAVAFVLELLSRREGSRVPSLGALFRGIMRSRPGRAGIMAGWAWLGLHFLAR